MNVLFTLLGWLGLGLGLLSLPAALFVGPHLLAVALGFTGFGLGSLMVASGFRRRTNWATWSGIALCAVPVLVAALAVYQAANAVEWDSVAVWGSVATFFAVTLVAIYTHRSGRRF